jgi:ketosteroid isomerase-like protein
VGLTHREIFERYVYATAIARNPDAIAELFTEDGIFDAPLVPEGHVLPRRLEGREAIRSGVRAYHELPDYQGTVDVERTRFVWHETTDPEVFITEIDAVFNSVDGPVTMSFVRIFRIRDGLIAMLRDYFSSPVP